MRAHEFTDQGAAGIVLYAEDTGRYGLQQRSNRINDGGLWAAWGGGREPDESLEQCARRELAEESGYTGPIKLQRLGENSKYVTFLGTVPHEFEPRSNDEWQDYCWVEAGDWPTPMHPGVAAALKNIAVKQNVDEAFDQPYPFKWEVYGEAYDALVKLDDGSNLEININPEYDEEGNEEWHVDFWRSSSIGVTGEGDAFRIFATVMAAMQDFIKREKPRRIVFTASKEVEPGQNSESRTDLYQRMVDRYARAWGFKVDVGQSGPNTVFTLTRGFGIRENFADGKVRGKSRPGRVKRAGASCDGSVTDLRAKARKYGGERGKMYHWCANMKGGKKK